ncbi:MAG: hypothetical protein ABR564_09440 [Candidatus Dormibacteria bacterium]
MPTALETCIRVAAAPAGDAGPWPLSRALAQLAPLGVRAEERFRALGSGRGRPLIHSQEARWHGLPVELEAISCREPGTLDEVALALPSHTEMLAADDVDESAFWELVDTFAAAVDARHGAIVDGEAILLEPPAGQVGWQRRFSRHFGLLVPAEVARCWPPAAAPYRRLPRSDLLVVLR